VLHLEDVDVSDRERASILLGHVSRSFRNHDVVLLGKPMKLVPELVVSVILDVAFLPSGNCP
jgi:hypothetical protein